MDESQLELPFDDVGRGSAPQEAAEIERPTALPCPSPSLPVPPQAPTAQDRANALHQLLTESTGVPVRLRITNNTSTMMSLRYEQAGGRAVVGLHHMFLHAPDPIKKALCTWVCKPRSKPAGRKLEAFIEEQRHLIAPRSSRRVALRTAGEYFDLQTLYDEVNAAEFGGSVDTPITWGRMPTRRRRRSIRFGSFTPSDNLIRIHPYLDQAFVPRYFVRYIVFHEMLHAHMGIEEGPTGRRLIHPPAFRAREEQYPDYGRSVAWLDNESNLRRLLRAPRS